MRSQCDGILNSRITRVVIQGVSLSEYSFAAHVDGNTSTFQREIVIDGHYSVGRRRQRVRRTTANRGKTHINICVFYDFFQKTIGLCDTV